MLKGCFNLWAIMLEFWLSVSVDISCEFHFHNKGVKISILNNIPQKNLAKIIRTSNLSKLYIECITLAKQTKIPKNIVINLYHLNCMLHVWIKTKISIGKNIGVGKESSLVLPSKQTRHPTFLFKKGLKSLFHLLLWF